MGEVGMILVSMVEMCLCVIFYSCSMTRFKKIRRCHMILWAAVLGVAQYFVLQNITRRAIQFAIYMAFHAILGIIFIDAFRVVWFYFVVFLGIRILLETGMGIFGATIPGENFPELLSMIFISSIQGIFVYYVWFFRKKYAQWKESLLMKMLLFPAVSLAGVLGFFAWEMKSSVFSYDTCYFVLIFAVAMNILFYILVERLEISYALEMRRNIMVS